jgi:hypothetical protein
LHIGLSSCFPPLTGFLASAVCRPLQAGHRTGTRLYSLGMLLLHVSAVSGSWTASASSRFLAPLRHMTKFPAFVALQQSQIPKEWLVSVNPLVPEGLCHRVRWPVHIRQKGCVSRGLKFRLSYMYPAHPYPVSFRNFLTMSAELIPLRFSLRLPFASTAYVRCCISDLGPKATLAHVEFSVCHSFDSWSKKVITVSPLDLSCCWRYSLTPRFLWQSAFVNHRACPPLNHFT